MKLNISHSSKKLPFADVDGATFHAESLTVCPGMGAIVKRF